VVERNTRPDGGGTGHLLIDSFGSGTVSPSLARLLAHSLTRSLVRCFFSASWRLEVCH
jgi:hypothetical protein